MIKMSDNTSLISTKGNVVIPSIYRKKFGYDPGMRIHFYELDGLLIISKDKIDNVEERILVE